MTTEANPDSVTPDGLAALRDAGFNRISFGMQSAVPHVLRVLERTHDPANVARSVGWARKAGFDQVSLDLIYGTPGESVADWRTSVEVALACEPDHVSAYSLIVEEGTRLARQVRTGVIPAPDEDDLAEKYSLPTTRSRPPGWSGTRSPTGRATPPLAAVTTGSTGPAPAGGASDRARTPTSRGSAGGTSSTPRAYAARIAAGESPALAGEVLDERTRAMERVLLEVRLREGLPLDLVERDRADAVVARGLGLLEGDHLTLTRDGRLLADAVVRDLVD